MAKNRIYSASSYYETEDGVSYRVTSTPGMNAVQIIDNKRSEVKATIPFTSMLDSNNQFVKILKEVDEEGWIGLHQSIKAAREEAGI